ncbi:YheC/YheD family protein [Brevibacillus sp. B_LB10_24]|uniref:YheC/YheD family endospore coat-associated protein n=1 Tax=Brevibacillus sp. B_LB10_24 TaxID=3380645 RepID=UPI0038BA8383
MGKPHIGILTYRNGHRFQEPGYFRRLISEGQKLGATVFLFSHEDAFERRRVIRGFTPSAKGGWESKLFPWPDVVIDRCRKGSPGYRQFRRKKLFLYANNTYTNKWNATQLFLKDDAVQRWMPDTVAYSPEHLRQMLKKYRLLYIKPGNGTGGRSILKLTRTAEGYTVLGRDNRLVKKTARFQTLPPLIQWLNRWVKTERIREGNFMIQQGLDLSLVPGRATDIRLLIQKNELGEWDITGLGIRIGGKNSSTSNLHGGGKAVPFESLMAERFGPEQTKSILLECHELARQVVHTIERHFGPMMEFGLDIGVDVNGRVWLIEVNPKPGREIFKRIGRMDLYRRSIQRPLQYALHLLQASKHPPLNRENTG